MDIPPPHSYLFNAFLSLLHVPLSVLCVVRGWIVCVTMLGMTMVHVLLLRPKGRRYEARGDYSLSISSSSFGSSLNGHGSVTIFVRTRLRWVPPGICLRDYIRETHRPCRAIQSIHLVPSSWTSWTLREIDGMEGTPEKITLLDVDSACISDGAEHELVCPTNMGSTLVTKS
jgi:hypothetical protein